MNARIVLSSLSILAAIALVGSGAYAAFSSTNSNNGNTFSSGTLTLNINGSATSSPVFTIVGKAPGYSEVGYFNLQNIGTVPASTVKLSSIGVAGSNLGDVITLELFKDDGNGSLGPEDTALGTAHLSDGVWTNYTLSGVSLPASGHQVVWARLTFDQSADDSHQNQSLTFNFNFEASQ